MYIDNTKLYLALILRGIEGTKYFVMGLQVWWYVYHGDTNSAVCTTPPYTADN